MSRQEFAPAASHGEGEKVYQGDGDHGQSTAPAPRVPCPPHCGLACALDRHLALVLADHLDAPPAERLAWCIVGLGDTPPPLPRHRWRDVFQAVAERYGPEVVADALRKVARRPVPHGLDLDAAGLTALADRWARSEGVAA